MGGFPMSYLRNVFGSDGTMHTELTVGNMRQDLTTGSISYTFGSTGNTQSVLRPDGTLGCEQTIGNMRYDFSSGKFDQYI